MMFEPSHNVAKVARGQKVANQMANVVNDLKVNLVVKATAVLKQVRRVMANVAQMVKDVVSRQRRYSSKCSIGTKMA